jgi:hypothetical protein
MNSRKWALKVGKRMPWLLKKSGIGAKCTLPTPPAQVAIPSTAARPTETDCAKKRLPLQIPSYIRAGQLPASCVSRNISLSGSSRHRSPGKNVIAPHLSSEGVNSYRYPCQYTGTDRYSMNLKTFFIRQGGRCSDGREIQPRPEQE